MFLKYFFQKMVIGTLDFEVYAEGDIHAEDYEMALWIPIVKEKVK